MFFLAVPVALAIAHKKCYKAIICDLPQKVLFSAKPS